MDEQSPDTELERMREFLTEAEDLGNLGVWEFDADGTLVWTDGTRRIHGVDAGFSPTMEQAIEFIHPEDREAIEQAIDAALEHGESYEREYRLITEQGDRRWVHVQGTVVDNEPPRTVRGFIQDITVRKQREQALQQTYATISDETLSFGEKVHALMEVVRDTVGTAYATLSHVQGDEYLFEEIATPEDADLQAGERVALSTTNCERVVETEQTLVLNDVEEDAPDLAYRAGNSEWGISSYLGAPVIVDGDVYGTFCFYDMDARSEEFSDWEVAFVDLLSDWVSTSLERQQIERDLQQEHDLVEGIVETSPVGIAVVDADGDLSFVNERAEQIYGRSREELDGFSHDDARWDLVDENGEPVESDELPFARVISREEPIYDHVVGLRRPSGDRVWVSVNGAPQYNQNGELERAVFTFEDITEQRDLEAELEEVFGRVTDAFYALDDRFQFTHVNERAEELLQASEAELLGEKLWDQYPEAADIDEVWDAFHTAMETQEPQSYDLYFDPLKFWVEATVYPSETGVSVYFRDSTEQREYEQELEHQNQQLEQFASVVSHDLRNPLNVIELRVDLAQEECNSDHLDAIEHAQERMETLIENLLALAREGDAVTEVEPVEIAALVEDCWTTVRTGEATIVTESTRTIQADRTRLKQVFENLFRNALEHGGTDVTVLVGDLADGFYIEDDGPGISATARDDVFEAGYTTSQEGTGFGLSIVEQIVDAHDWEVRITDGIDGGTRFEITGVTDGSE